jgi:hypothetical protein
MPQKLQAPAERHGLSTEDEYEDEYAAPAGLEAVGVWFYK